MIEPPDLKEKKDTFDPEEGDQVESNDENE